MYLVFDTETTGLPKNYEAPLTDADNWPRMVQIAWQLHDDDGTLLENQDYIIKPEGFDIPYSSYAIHGISTEMAHAEGRDLKEVLLEFKEVLDKATFGVGQNIDFDYKIIGAEFIRKEIENQLQEIPQLDTMHLGKDYAAILNRSGKIKPPKLSEIFEKLFDTTFEEAHNAAADVNATAQVFFEMLRRDIIDIKENNIAEESVIRLKQKFTRPIPPFDIVIRRQVAKTKRKRKVVTGNIEDIELGNYFNFHNHSIFSALQSSSSISSLVNAAVKNDFPAVGLVDLGNMMGAFKFISEVENTNKILKKKQEEYEENKKKAEEEGIAFTETSPQSPLIPVLGCEFYISDRYQQKQFTKDDPDRRTQVVLLAKNFEGYKNLAKLSSIGFVEGFYFGVPRISREIIAQYKENLIVLSGGLLGDIPSTILESGEQRGEEIFTWWKETFGDDFYVQIQEHGIQEEEYVNDVLLRFAEKYGVKVLAQNETYYSEKSDANIQDILSCIKDGEKQSTPVGKGFGRRRGLPSNEFYLKDREDIQRAFLAYPQAFEAYDELIEKFEPYTLKRDVLLPKFDIPQEFQHAEDAIDGGKRGENAYLRHLTYEGARAKYNEITPEIEERLDFELQVIANTGYPGYFLIVQDFCNEARKMGVSVGPGRGSAAGSAVAYCIGITNVDPIAYDLLFERFLNPERISMPDIDIDFDDEGRDRVIKWVVEKYGKTNVAQIITYSVLGGKSAIKDAGRVLDLPIPETNNIAKLVPSTPGMNIKKAFAKYDKHSPEDKILVDEMKEILANPSDQRYPVLSAAQKMEGAIRNTGIHACGVIITPEDISNIVPITIAAKDSDVIVSQFDNSVAESAGLLKMDFLGLRTLTIIKDAIKLIKANHGIEINTDHIPLDDEKTYQLFQEGRTIGIFQYESPGMQKYMRELKPTVFADLIAMNALYRPGPIKYIPNFINRKHGIEEIVYDLPENEEYLAETYGITVYQEQVMLLSQKLANFTKGEADTLRKAMGKKQKDVLDKMYPKFIEGGKANQLNEEKLNKIWKDWEAFAEYAFNKSHSTCYALIAYHTAYLKANYPAEYMASVLTHNLNNTKQITLFMEDCKTMGVDVLGPNVNESEYEFSVNEKGQIRFGLGAIKGIGEGPSEAIVQTRQEAKFQSALDFFERIPSSQINKKVVESLVLAGALDEIDHFHRAQYFAEENGKTNIEKLLKYGQSFQAGKSAMENSLFADFADEVRIETPKILPSPEWQNMKKLNMERDIIGFYLSGHPLDEYKVQYDFVAGNFSKEAVLFSKNADEVLELAVATASVDDLPDVDEASEVDMMEENEIEEKSSKKAEPKGSLNFLALDEIDAYREQNFGPEQIRLFEEIKDYREKQRFNNNSKEFTTAGIISDYIVKDGNNSGEKFAFATLEDYSGSFSFRLGDKDYMRLRDKLDLHRFIILRFRFTISRDGRVFINVTDAFDLLDAFDLFAKKISFLVSPEKLTRGDVEFLRELIAQYEGEKPISFYIENTSQGNNLETKSTIGKLEIQKDLVKKLKDYQHIPFFLN